MTTELTVPKGFRLHIGAFGRRNVGKSSTLNALTRQNASIVSATPGTTTDPVEKAMELLPLGPVVLIDTAGIDDAGALGQERIARTRKTFDRVDLALVVVDASRGSDAWSEFEQALVDEFQRRKTPVLVVANKTDAADPLAVAALATSTSTRGLEFVSFSAKDAIDANAGAPRLLAAIARMAPDDFLAAPPIVSDLVPPGSFVVLVTPIDKEAPKGRLILPQVQTIRDLLDAGLGCVVVQENMLEAALKRATEPPALVVTDSQAFKTVAQIVPTSIPLTSFSILFARQKCDLAALVAGARSLDRLTPSSSVLIAEACSHHPITEDIGTVKLPRALRKKYGETLAIDNLHGHDFPDGASLRRYDLIVHCGGCMFNRREILSRSYLAMAAGVPMTNYGLALAALNGILDRALEPFETLQRTRGKK